MCYTLWKSGCLDAAEQIPNSSANLALRVSITRAKQNAAYMFDCKAGINVIQIFVPPPMLCGYSIGLLVSNTQLFLKHVCQTYCKVICVLSH